MTSLDPATPTRNRFPNRSGERARSEVAVAPMSLAMIPEVMAIDTECYPVPWTRDYYRAELSRPDDRLYLVARTAGPDRRIVGHGGMAFEGGEARITIMTVAPSHQGQGIGTRLLLALALAARRRSTRLALEVAADNPTAQALYRRFGLAPVGIRRGYYADMDLPPDAVVMQADDIHLSDYANRLINISIELDRP